jgi:hypothetical protein
MAVIRISALDGIIGLIEEGITLVDNSVIKIGYLNRFTY